MRSRAPTAKSTRQALRIPIRARKARACSRPACHGRLPGPRPRRAPRCGPARPRRRGRSRWRRRSPHTIFGLWRPSMVRRLSSPAGRGLLPRVASPRSMIGVEAGDQDSGLRLAELLAAFSLATDLGMGQPMEHVLRSWLIAGRLGERLGLGAEARVSLYYVMMLAWVGCVADTAEVAAWFGDDIAFRGDSYRVDLAGLPLMGFALSHAGAGAPFLHRLRLATNLILTGGRAVERGLMSHCLTTTQMAGRLGLPSEVCDPLRQVFTRWDAKGVPEGVGGEQIAGPVRLFHLADTVEVFHRVGGVDAALEVARARRGMHFDPAVVDLFCGTAPEVLADMDAVAECTALMEAEPGLCRYLSERELDSALETVAGFTDLRAPLQAGRSPGVTPPT